MDREQNILRYILEAELIAKDYNDLKEEYINMVNRLIVALDERDEYQGKLHYLKQQMKKMYTEENMHKIFYLGCSLQTDLKIGNVKYKPKGELFKDYMQNINQSKQEKQ